MVINILYHQSPKELVNYEGQVSLQERKAIPRNKTLNESIIQNSYE